LTGTVDNAWLDVKLRGANDAAFTPLGSRSAVTAATTDTVCPGAWALNGNYGNTTANFLGTTDGSPLTLKVDGLQAGAITVTNTSDSPSVVFGSSQNVATGDGATISGGGGNSITAFPNTASYFAAVGGGDYNSASGGSSAIAGGSANTAGG